jgi:hypothetical protein
MVPPLREPCDSPDHGTGAQPRLEGDPSPADLRYRASCYSELSAFGRSLAPVPGSNRPGLVRRFHPAGRSLITAPDAHLTLSLAGLVLGRIVPRTLEVDRGEFAMTREISGSVTLGSGQDGDSSPDPGPLDLRQLRDEFVHPVTSDRGPSQSRWDQLQRAHFLDTTVTFRDRGSGLVILASGMDLDVVRAKNGRVHGSVKGLLSLSGEQTSVAAAVDLTPTGAPA